MTWWFDGLEALWLARGGENAKQGVPSEVLAKWQCPANVAGMMLSGAITRDGQGRVSILQVDGDIAEAKVRRKLGSQRPTYPHLASS